MNNYKTNDCKELPLFSTKNFISYKYNYYI